MPHNQMKSQDRRTRYTKEAIRNAFLRIKRSKPYNSVTVSDLCREAEISRGTFYLHYGNIAEVLDEVLNEALSQISGLFAQLNLEERENGCPAYPFCHFIRDHIKYRCIFFDDTLTSYIINRTAEMYLPEITPRLEKNTNLNRTQIEALFYFQMNGCLAVSKRYANLDKENWSMTQCTIDDFLNAGYLRYLRNEKHNEYCPSDPLFK